jgi:osmotically-inducible protein OsmY
VRGVRAVVDLVEVRSFPRTDAELESAVGTALATDPVLADLRVMAQAQAGLVTLSGRVDSEAAREAAKDDSAGVPGVREVVDRLSMGSPTRPSDSHLHDEVSRAIHDDPWMAGARVSAWVDQGIVHLRGQVACYEQLRRAVRDAASAAPPGIDASGLVIDRSVDRGSALRSCEAILADAAIAEALRHAYAIDPRLQSFVPTVGVNRGVVVLTGLAPNQDAARAAGEDARHVVGAVGITDRMAVASSSLASDPALRPALTALEGLPGAAAGAANSAPPGAPSPVPSVPLPIRDAHDQSVAVYFAARRLRWVDANEKLGSLADCIRKIHDDTVSDSASIPRLQGLQASLTEAIKEKDRWMSMIQANELSAALAALAAPYTPGVSVEVHQLDYYGRALQIAEEYRNPSAIRPLVDELQTRWARVRPEVASRDADDTTRFDAALTRLEHAQSQNELARATDAELEVAYSVRHALSRP